MFALELFPGALLSLLSPLQLLMPVGPLPFPFWFPGLIYLTSATPTTMVVVSPSETVLTGFSVSDVFSWVLDSNCEICTRSQFQAFFSSGIGLLALPICSSLGCSSSDVL